MLQYKCQGERTSGADDTKNLSKKLRKNLDTKHKMCYNNNVKGRWATAPKKNKKSFQNPLTSQTKGAIIKAQRTKEVVIRRKKEVLQNDEG